MRAVGLIKETESDRLYKSMDSTFVRDCATSVQKRGMALRRAGWPTKARAGIRGPTSGVAEGLGERMNMALLTARLRATAMLGHQSATSALRARALSPAKVRTRQRNRKVKSRRAKTP